MTRRITKDKRVQDDEGRWFTQITAQRCCNGCHRSLGDVNQAEIRAAMAGKPLPDVRDECGCANA